MSFSQCLCFASRFWGNFDGETCFENLHRGADDWLSDYNRAAFNAKASELMSEGHIVLNPAVLPGGLCQSEYMDICLAMVRSADAIYLLKGWEASAGSTSRTRHG